MNDIIERTMNYYKRTKKDQWEYYKRIFLNHTSKIQRSKNEYDIISPGLEKDIRVTWFNNDIPKGHAEININELDLLILEYIEKDLKITEII